jgi:hypothetical protein
MNVLRFFIILVRLVVEGGSNDLHGVGYVYMWYGGDGKFGCSIIC